MQLKNELYTVDITRTDATLSGKDNFIGDFVYNLDNYAEDDLVAILTISISDRKGERKIVLITDILTAEEQCAILENEVLTVLQNTVITQFNMNDCSVISHISVKGHGCLWRIYDVKGKYLIYGEEAILMLDKEFNLLWNFYGLDIFASVTGKEAFSFDDSKIMLYDFLDNYYEIDFNGKILKENIISRF